MLRTLLREPLVHFLLLGAALFLLDAWLRPPAAPGAATSEIVVTEARVRNLAQSFRRTWQRPPTRDELDGLVESYVREEIFVREATALGLDRDDAIVRRRLQQKMEFVSEEAMAMAEPSDDELQAYLDAHTAAFRTEPHVSFVQVFLDPRKRGAALPEDAQRLMAALEQAGASVDVANTGDRLMLLEARYENTTQSEVARLFGDEFADALLRQPAGRWAGPIASGYGMHIVRVEKLVPAAAPSLSEVRPLVEREWFNARRQELSRALYDRLRTKYSVRVQMPASDRR